MILGSIGPIPLIVILVIVILLFGTKKLRNIGSDLGEALKNFRKSVKDGEHKEGDSDSDTAKPSIEQATKKEGSVYSGEVVNKEKDKDKQA